MVETMSSFHKANKLVHVITTPNQSQSIKWGGLPYVVEH